MKKILFCVLLVMLILAGCQNKIVDDAVNEDNDNNQFSIQVSWENGSSDTTSTNMLIPLSEMGTGEKKYSRANSPFIIIGTAVKATLVDADGNVQPDTEFTYVFSETPESTVTFEHNGAYVSFSEPGDGTLNILANGVDLSTTIPYKVFTSGYVGKVGEQYLGVTIYPEYDFTTQTNQAEGGDIIYQNGYIYAPYGAVKGPRINSYEEFDAIKDISALEYTPGYLWEGDYAENALRYTFFIRTEEGGYIKFYPTGQGIVPAMYDFYFDYSADGTF